MVPMVDRAKLVELKRLRREMRGIMAETGIEDASDPGLETDTEEAAEGEADMDPVERAAHEAREPTEGDIDELMRLKRDYFRPKPKASRPGAGLVIAVEAGPKKHAAPMHHGSGKRKGY